MCSVRTEQRKIKKNTLKTLKFVRALLNILHTAPSGITVKILLGFLFYLLIVLSYFLKVREEKPNLMNIFT